MGVDIQFSQRYFWLNSWVLANIVQLATQDFCENFLNFQNDPGRRMFDQMVLAARCIPANIAEGSSRKNTSIETEMRLLDVARASNDELFGDYFNFILRRSGNVWQLGQKDREEIWKTHLDPPNYSNSLHHDVAIHILRQKVKYDYWLKNADPCIISNAMIVLCLRLNKMIESLMKSQLDEFRAKGGFTENMTQERLNARRAAPDAPKCPVCGEKMIRRVVKKGANSGAEFWGCSNYPHCNGFLSISGK